jgi:multicomponent Na+:H+ antiporter subunit F
MILAISPVLLFVCRTVLVVLVFSILLALIRLMRGPNLADRVVALELTAILAVSFLGVYTVARDEPVLLNSATVLALISFLGTVAFAYYATQRKRT